MSSIVIYARRSSEDEERQVLSIPAQITELQNLAKSRGLTISRLFEESQSARRPGRPLFNEMVSEIDKGRITGILCWKPDRLARNMIDGGRIIDALDREVLSEIVSPGRTFRHTSDDKFMLNLEFSMSKKYVDDLSDNIRRGNRAVLASGRSTCQVPLGYMKDAPADRLRGRGAGRTVKDPERFPLVAELFKKFLSGAYSVPELARYVRDTLGLRTRGTRRFPSAPLGMTGLYALLRNPFYAGFIKQAGEIYQGDHEAMVTKEEFDRIGTLIRRRDVPRPQTHEFLFRGLLHCGRCHRAVVGEEHWNHRYGIRYVYYRCGRKRLPEVVCGEPYVREPDVEREVTDTLAKLTVPEQLLAWTMKKIDATAELVVATEKAAELALQREREAKARELDRLLGLCARGVLTETEFVKARMEVLAEVNRLDAEIRDPRRRESEADQKLKTALSLAASAALVFKEGESDERRELLGAVAEKITVKNRKANLELRRPYKLLAEALEEYRNETEKDSNHAKIIQNRRVSLSKVIATTRRTSLRRRPQNERHSNHALAQAGIEKTAEVDPAISSWWTRVNDVRTFLLSRRPDAATLGVKRMQSVRP